MLCKRGVVGSKFFFWSDYCKITSIQFVVLINIMVCVCTRECLCGVPQLKCTCTLVHSLLSAFIRHKAGFSWELAQQNTCVHTCFLEFIYAKDPPPQPHPPPFFFFFKKGKFATVAFIVYNNYAGSKCTHTLLSVA